MCDAKRRRRRLSKLFRKRFANVSTHTIVRSINGRNVISFENLFCEKTKQSRRFVERMKCRSNLKLFPIAIDQIRNDASDLVFQKIGDEFHGQMIVEIDTFWVCLLTKNKRLLWQRSENVGVLFHADTFLWLTQNQTDQLMWADGLVVDNLQTSQMFQRVLVCDVCIFIL